MTKRGQIPPLQNEKIIPFERPKNQQLEHYQQLQQKMESGNTNDGKNEFSAELSVPANPPVFGREERFEQMDWHRAQGTSVRRIGKRIGGESANDTAMFIGWAALALSLISLFVMPGILGAIAIILGMFAVVQGNRLGVWAVLIGFVSIATSLLLLPFFS